VNQCKMSSSLISQWRPSSDAAELVASGPFLLIVSRKETESKQPPDNIVNHHDPTKT